MPKKGQAILEEERIPLEKPLVGDRNLVNHASNLPPPPPSTSNSSNTDRLTEVFNALTIQEGKEQDGDDKIEKFYITTAINYTNGDPHMGHAYEAISTDAIARYHRMYGRDVFFLTGTDEHGQKIANRAETEGVKPIDICDKYANGFVELNKKLRISNDSYIRTTMPHHYKSAQTLWELCAKENDIYESVYEGWYNEREETFVTENEAQLSDYKDPTSGLPLKKMDEKSYFFRQSRYQNELIQHIKQNLEFVQPASIREHILTRLQEPLLDVSVSRTTFAWGIPVPEGFDPAHVMYVWFDALSNYLSGIHALVPLNEAIENQFDPRLKKYWPADCHIIGKDIVWFHCVIWPCMLMSAHLPLPKTVFAHGFINGPDHRKMSKSLGNVVNPNELLAKYSPDTFRYYLSTSATYGGDLDFLEENLIAKHNAELADTLGNLIHRTFNLLHKNAGGEIPDCNHTDNLDDVCYPFDISKCIAETEEAMKTFSIEKGSYIAMEITRNTNKFLTDMEPWKLKKTDEENLKKAKILRMTAEATYVLAHFLAPYIPTAATLIFEKLQTPPRPIKTLNTEFHNLTPGTKLAPLQENLVLFTKIMDSSEEQNSSKISNAEQARLNKEAKQKLKEEKVKSAKKGKDSNEVEQPDWSKIDIRVGEIVNVWNHPDADRLFCEEINVGEEEPRKIASGLREHYTLEQMQGKKILVVCNLKTAKLAGFESSGMVLCAKKEDKVELVNVPENSIVGERLSTMELGESISSFDPFSPGQVKKKKIWEMIAEGLMTNSEGQATFQGVPLVTSAGVCTSSLFEAPIN